MTTTYTVRGRTTLGNTEINKSFTNEKDALAYIRKLGAKQGVGARIIKIEDNHRYEYCYSPKRAEVMKVLETNNIPYELDNNLNITITF